MFRYLRMAVFNCERRSAGGSQRSSSRDRAKAANSSGSPQIGGDASDVGIAERLREARHDDARYAVLRADATQHDLDQIGGIGQVQRAVEREFRPDRERRVARIVVTGRAGGRVEPRIGIDPARRRRARRTSHALPLHRWTPSDRPHCRYRQNRLRGRGCPNPEAQKDRCTTGDIGPAAVPCRTLTPLRR